MKKIITSVGMLVFVGAMVVAGTGAFFNDTETSTGNVFTAGALDLKVDSVAHINGLVCFDGTWIPEELTTWDSQNGLVIIGEPDIEVANTAYNEENPANVPQAGEDCAGTWELTDLGLTHTFFNYGDLKPGDQGENTISLHVNNNDAYMCATIETTEDKDNTLTEPETEVPDTDGLASGELDSELNFFVWEDDGDNLFEEAELEGVLVNGAVGTSIDGTYPLYTPSTGVFPGGETKYLGVYWCYGDLNVSGTNVTCDGGPVTNVSQTDSLKANVSFYIEQARNNGNFECPGTEVPPPATHLTLAKTVTPAEVVPDSAFTLTATGPSVISGIEGAVTVTNASVLPGVYTLTESAAGPGGETLTWSCTGNATPEVGNTVTIALGESVTCEATNSYSG